MNRWSSPQTVRSMLGQGSRSTRYPPPPLGTLLAWSSTTSALIPGSGRMAEPGLVAVTPGSGLIMMPPVSVCHQVSTTGVSPRPMVCRYQIHASGLIGSPTDPSRRSEDRSCWAGNSSPHFIMVRISVGAVYRMVTLYFSTISQNRPRFGVSGVPSYMTWVAALDMGPYTMYEWPVTQPMSAVHQYTSVSGLRSKTAWWVYETW